MDVSEEESSPSSLADCFRARPSKRCSGDFSCLRPCQSSVESESESVSESEEGEGEDEEEGGVVVPEPDEEGLDSSLDASTSSSSHRSSAQISADQLPMVKLAKGFAFLGVLSTKLGAGVSEREVACS